MNKSLQDIEAYALTLLLTKVNENLAMTAARHCAWLHGAGYNGMKYLAEALADVETTIHPEPDAMGLDLKGISCVFISKQIEAVYASHGRLFLRNVRHGLYLLPESVRGNYGIGCPVDPAFALGGERSKNPYAEKMDLAIAQGVEIDDLLWQSLVQV
jgi:hypothetical protein